MNLFGNSRSGLGSLVQLSHVTGCVLRRAERNFSSTRNHDSNDFGVRHAFLRKIEETRALVARLLIVFRWSKSMNDSIYKFLSAPEVKVQSSFTEIMEFLESKRFQKKEMQLNAKSIKVHSKIIMDKKQAFSNLLTYQIPTRIKKIIVTKNKIYFFAPHLYSFSLKANKYGAFKLNSFNVKWPKDFDISKQILIRFACLLNKFTNQINLILPRFDRILYNLFLIGQFLRGSKFFYKFSSDYPIRIERTHYLRALRLTFPSLYGPMYDFYFSIRMGHISISSRGVINVFKDSDVDSLLPFETFNRFNEMDSNEMNLCLLTFAIPNNFNYYDILLSSMRDLVYYTKLSKIWKLAIHAIRSVSFAFFNLKMIFTPKSSTFGRIDVSLNDFVLMSITINTWTGMIQIIFDDIVGIDSIDFQVNIVDPDDLYTIISKVLANFAIHASVVRSYGYHYPSTVFFKNPKKYFRTFSFAPDFKLYIQTDLGHPHVFIFDNNFNHYTTPEIAEMDSSTIVVAWSLLCKALDSAKSLILLLQTQIYLRKFGFESVRSGNNLNINLTETRTCKVSINENGWSFLLMPSMTSGIDLQESTVIFTGKYYSERLSNMIADFIKNLQLYRSNCLNLITLSKQTQSLKSLHLTGDYQVICTFNNVHKTNLYLSYGDGLKSNDTHRDRKYFSVSQIFSPHAFCKLATFSALNLSVQSIIRKSPDTFALSFFVNQSAIPLLNFFELFGADKNFTVTYLSNFCFSLICRNRFSLLVRIKPVHYFVFHLPSQISHIILLLPLSIVRSGPIYSYRIADVKMENLPKLKEAIIKFTDFYHIIEHYHFRILSQTSMSPNPILTFIAKNYGLTFRVSLHKDSFDFSIDENQELSNNFKIISQNFGINAYLFQSLMNLVYKISHDKLYLTKISQLISTLKVQRNYTCDEIIKAINSVTVTPNRCFTISFSNETDDFMLSLSHATDSISIKYYRGGQQEGTQEAKDIQQLLLLIDQKTDINSDLDNFSSFFT